MHIVRTLIWALLAVALALFAAGNWQLVEVAIGNGMVLETRLAVLVIGAFLLGLMPMWLIHRAAMWRLNRRLSAATAPPPASDADLTGHGTNYSADPVASEYPPAR